MIYPLAEIWREDRKKLLLIRKLFCSCYHCCRKRRERKNIAPAAESASRTEDEAEEDVHERESIDGLRFQQAVTLDDFF